MKFTMNWLMPCQSILVWTQCQKDVGQSPVASHKSTVHIMLNLNFDAIKVLTG